MDSKDRCDLISYEEAAKNPQKYRVALRIASPGDLIPRSAYLISDREPTEADIARGHELEALFGWDV
jgi:hypothetical protein